MSAPARIPVPDHPTRTLRTILAVEVADYVRQMREAEEDTAAALAHHRGVIGDLVAARGGRIFTTADNNVLAEFESPVEAVRCALEIQEGVAVHHLTAPALRPLRFRVGVHTGDVLRTGDNLLGDAVNVAARLESIAEPGSIFISREVKDFIEPKLSVRFRFRGNEALKNIARPVATYEITTTPEPAWQVALKGLRRRRRLLALVAGLAVLLCGVGWLAYDSASRLRAGIAVPDTPARPGATILSQQPRSGSLAYGQKVLVDDGRCPAGEVNEVTGGSTNLNVARGFRCVIRPR